MLNIAYFVQKFPDVLMNEQNDHVFSNIKLLTGGTTAPRISKVINFSVALMDDDECYVEVGVFTGCNLCSAAYTNPKKCFGIDNFDMSLIGGNVDADFVRARCINNLSTLAKDVTLIESDFRKVTKEMLGGKKIASTFIDANHTYQDVFDNLLWLEDKLADNAVIFFDDVNLNAVDKGLKEWWLNRQNQYDLIFYSKPIFIGTPLYPIYDKFLHNGLGILRYSKNGF